MILRHTLLFLSRRRGLQRWVATSRLARPLVSRFIAGQTLEDALALSQRLSQNGVMSTLDRLGESVTSPLEVEETRDGYLEALHRVAELQLPLTFSIKLTHFGLDLSEEACRAHVENLVREAHRLGKMVEVDMESNAHVDRTLRLVFDLHQAYGNVRGVIQAYLYRSEKDIERLCQHSVPVRLCKGAYSESPTIAFSRKPDVNANYVRLMKVLLERGVYPGLATHDQRIIEEAKRFAQERRIPPQGFEFQMLYGIRRDLEKQLVQQGYRLRLYVPYGDAWYPYFMRRLAERPANLLFLLRNLVRG
jgi:proline dehydrogenase